MSNAGLESRQGSAHYVIAYVSLTAMQIFVKFDREDDYS